MYYQPLVRRDFFKKAGLLTASLATLKLAIGRNETLTPVHALHNIPEEKNLNKEWVRSLFDRGEATAYLKSKNELRYIGMPVGGLHTGTVYVGGDGRLWLWQIFNQTMEGEQEGIEPKTVRWNDGSSDRMIKSRDGSAYVEPAIADSLRVLDQGFAVRAVIGSLVIIKELNESHWDEVIFKPAYPVATVEYKSADIPFEVRLLVYSPFIPLDAKNSSLPATILKVSLINKSDQSIEVSILGWMENAASKISAKEGTGKHKNSVFETVSSVSVFSSFDATNAELKELPDSGTSCISLLQANGRGHAQVDALPITGRHFEAPAQSSATVDAPQKLIGGISFTQSVAPGKTLTADFVICWHFNIPHKKLPGLVKDAAGGFYYGARYEDAQDVSNYVQAHFAQLTGETELWSKTWNDSTLPCWFLERSFVNISTLATANTYRFANGRFWSWEGVGACPGTCTHVWQYAQAVARIFPELEQDLRERVDLGVGFDAATGAIRFRGEDETRPAIDGQAGTILRFYREHQMSGDSTFLRENWTLIKKSVQFMLLQDKNGDGMTDSPMENTLDAVWEGEIAWIVGLCLAAAAAAHAMAIEINDLPFARICAKYVSTGTRNMEENLFNGEYFIHRPDAVAGRAKLGSYNTCHIDQVYGQSWAFQVGLPRIISREKSLSALRALWKYNFTNDVGPYIKTHTGGRPYALAGDGGMLMNTNPHNEEKPYGENTTWQLGYFNECMSGFEHQVAAHFMAEGMLEESLVLTRVIHDRYHAAKRNPFNEIECSDHYARAMASYGTFINACGFQYHGPKGYIRFAPKWDKTDCKFPFTSAKGWGTYSQKTEGNANQEHRLELMYGKLELERISLDRAISKKRNILSVSLDNVPVAAGFHEEGDELIITLKKRITLSKDQSLRIVFS